MRSTLVRANGLAAACSVLFMSAFVHATTAPPASPKANQDDQQDMRFDDASRWARAFDDPARDAWQKPDLVIAAPRLEPTSVVADIGAGTGCFASRIAAKVPQGRVYAVDIEPDMITHLSKPAAAEHRANLQPVLASPNDAKLPDRVDVILIVDTYHHIAARAAYFRRLADFIRPGGRLVIVDYKRDAPDGPPVRYRLQPPEIAAELAPLGYQLSKPADVGTLPYQFLMVFEPPARQP